MKNKVKYSAYSITVTAAILIIFAVGIVTNVNDTDSLAIFCLIMGGCTLAGLFYCPISVEASQSAVTLRRLLGGNKTFKCSDIASVDTCYPSAGGLRLCGSGGAFGYWGYFSDIMIGTYFGYYGSRSHCFVVKLKSGKQYVLGCENPDAMVEFIDRQISQPSQNH